MKLTIRDSATGRGLAAKVDIYGGQLDLSPISKTRLSDILEDPTRAPRSERANDFGYLSFELASTPHLLVASYPGHRNLPLLLAPDDDLRGVVIWLDPLTLPTEIDPIAVGSRSEAGYALLHGHVHDASRGRPVAGAVVRWPGLGLEVYTDEHGYFEGFVPVPWLPPGASPELTELSVEAVGYRRHRLHDIPLVEGEGLEVVLPVPVNDDGGDQHGWLP